MNKINEPTRKQKKFADYYIKTGNATKSYLDAGYKVNEKTAAANASRLLTNAKVKTYIDKVIEKKDKKIIMSQDEVLRELSKIGRSKITDYLQVEEREVFVGYEENEDGNPDMQKPIKRKCKIVDIYPTEDIEDVKIGAISEIKQTKEGISLKLYDKVRALEALAKRYGLDKPDNDKAKGEIEEDALSKSLREMGKDL